MEAWVVVCWFLHRPPAAENIWLLRAYRAEQLCRNYVQKMKDQAERDDIYAQRQLGTHITFKGLQEVDCSCKRAGEPK